VKLPQLHYKLVASFISDDIFEMSCSINFKFDYLVVIHRMES